MVSLYAYINVQIDGSDCRPLTVRGDGLGW